MSWLKPQLRIRLRCVSYGQQQWSTNKGSQPYLRLPDGQSKQHKHRRISSIGHTFPSNATAFIRRQIKPLQNLYACAVHVLAKPQLCIYVAWAMDGNNEVPTKAASPTSDYQMANPNSTNIAGFHQSDTLFPRMPLPSWEGRSNHYKTLALSHVLAKPQLCIRLRYVGLGQQLWSTNKGSQPYLRLPDGQSKQHINRTHFSLECHCPHQKADQTTIKPVCMRCPCLGKTTTLHLRCVSFVWTATMKYQQRQPALPQITRWPIQTAQTSQDFINRTHFSLECHCPHQKADQTTINLHACTAHVLAKPQLCIRLRCVSYGQQQRSTNKGSQPFLR